MILFDSDKQITTL